MVKFLQYDTAGNQMFLEIEFSLAFDMPFAAYA